VSGAGRPSVGGAAAFGAVALLLVGCGGDGERPDLVPEIPASGWAAVEVYPEALTVEVGARLPLRAVGWSGPVHGDLTATWESRSSDVVTVDEAGVATAIAPGDVIVDASTGDVTGSAFLHVVDASTVSLHVTDAVTGLPLAGAVVSTATDSAVADVDGLVALPSGGPAPVSMTVQAGDGYDSFYLVDVVGRKLTVPLPPSHLGDRPATIEGAVDFDGVEAPGIGGIQVGFACAAETGPGALEVADLFAPARDVTLLGQDASLPSNLFAADGAPTYVATAPVGADAVWGFAGPLPVLSLAGSDGPGGALDLLVSHVESLSWGTSVAASRATVDQALPLDLSPDLPLSDDVKFALPALPPGFAGDEPWFLLVGEIDGQGRWRATGLGMQTGDQWDLEAAAVPAGTAGADGRSVAFAEVGGFGTSGSSITVVVDRDAAGVWRFPAPLDLPTVDDWQPATRMLTVTAPPEAQWVRVRVTDPRGRVKDVLLPGSWSGVLPSDGAPFQLGEATVTIVASRSAAGVREGWLAAGDLSLAATNPEVAARSVWQP